jgi:hypothetical protein
MLIGHFISDAIIQFIRCPLSAQQLRKNATSECGHAVFAFGCWKAIARHSK